MHSYPLQLTFKLVAVAPQLAVTDATGRLLLYVRQKAFRLKEAVTVFADREQMRPLYAIAADRVIDFAARYDVTAADGRSVGAVQRQGMRSLWRAHFDVFRGSTTVASIREEKGWVKLVDGLIGELPIVGMFTGYFLHPSYLVVRADGTPALRVRKQPAMFEGRYVVERLADLPDADEELALLAVLMMLLLERTRG
jgi:hypothetical protein